MLKEVVFVIAILLHVRYLSQLFVEDISLIHVTDPKVIYELMMHTACLITSHN